MAKEFKDQKHRNKIIDRIQKILALANSTSFVEEAKTAMRMAKGLMKSFGLSMSEVDLKESIENDIMEETTDICGRLMNWKKILGLVIEELCDTKLIISHEGYRRIGLKFIGMEADVKLSIILYNSFKIAMQNLAIKNYSSKPYRTSYLLGLVDKLLARAVEENKLAKRETESEIKGGTSGNIPTYNALVVLKEQEINKYVAKNIGKLSNGKIKYGIHKEPYEKGRADGDNFDLQNKKKIG